jgi:hypothetical protein
MAVTTRCSNQAGISSTERSTLCLDCGNQRRRTSIRYPGLVMLSINKTGHR